MKKKKKWIFVVILAVAFAFSACGCSAPNFWEQWTCDHEFVGEEVKAATCSEEGEILITCEKCGVEETRAIPKIEHVMELSEEVASSCTADGARKYTCATCDLTEWELIAAPGHSLVLLEGYAATCTKDGRTDGWKCETCGTVTVAQETIVSPGHNIDERTAICTICGYDDGHWTKNY